MADTGPPEDVPSHLEADVGLRGRLDGNIGL